MNASLSISLVALALGPVAAGLGGGSSPTEEPKPAPLAAPAPAKVPAGDPLHVLIVEPDGTPAPGARVWVTGTGERETVLTDRDGRAVVPDRAEGKCLIVERGDDGTGPGPRPRALGYWMDFGRSGTEDDPARITLRPLERRVTVRVIDESGAAIEGVRVVVEGLMDMGTFGFGIRELEGRATLTREDSIRLFGEPETGPGGSVSLLVPDRTRASVATDDVRHRWSEPVDITPGTKGSPAIVLRPGGGITGLVSDAETGEPAAGIRVMATSLEKPPGSHGFRRVVAESGPDGRYLIPGAMPGVYSVRQVGGPDSDRLAEGVRGVRVEAGADATADLELVAARTISGVLVSEQDGQPMPGIQLGFGRRDGGPGDLPRSVQTDEAGRFAISVMPGDTWIVTIAGENQVVGGFQSLDVPEDRDPEFLRLECRARPDLITLTVPERRGLPTAGEVGHFAVNLAGQLAGQLAQEYWKVGQGHRVIRGRVVDPSGQPVAGAYVWNIRDQQRDADYRVRGIPMDGKGATTDRHGVFILDEQPEGELTLGVWRAPEGIREEIVARGVDEVEFTLPVRR